jgi:hypothetical protein
MPVSLTSATCLILSLCFLLARTIPIEAKIAKIPKAPPTAIPIIVDKDKVADPMGTCVCMDLVKGPSSPSTRGSGAISARYAFQ